LWLIKWDWIAINNLLILAQSQPLVVVFGVFWYVFVFGVLVGCMFMLMLLFVFVYFEEVFPAHFAPSTEPNSNYSRNVLLRVQKMIVFGIKGIKANQFL
jgi:hypothetical protein